MTTTDQPRFSYSLHNVTTTVSDLDASIAWWNRVFGLTLLAKSRFDAIGADVAFLQGPGFRLELLQPADGFRIPELTAEPPAHIRPIGTKALVFRVEDLGSATEVLREQGVTILWERMDLGDGSVSTAIRDNDGNFINIFEEGASPVG
ncbi:VOC family protein [Streptacidiphilus sp. ASG 303]|uniref:VOC family protein n=1 Tax=Streptacidiphilus sp. ASG 303 TaxID=2896847 RepID=UPI001E3A0C85|nr:VOC family protein [Streptacidiphilus sp. ASG 303]MCD0486009.1 VOC family protein [Streptacidiphilus sp. ASG 303]